MTRDEIIDMANRAHAYIDRHFLVASSTGIASFEHFARLVAEREREACAKVCDDMTANEAQRVALMEASRRIRARGQE
jgi:isopropylmalate/homocitrate/citramalate synthase